MNNCCRFTASCRLLGTNSSFCKTDFKWSLRLLLRDFSSGRAQNASYYASTRKALNLKLGGARSLSQSGKDKLELRKKSTLLYMSGLAVFVVGLSYAAVPLYRIFCQATGYGGEIVIEKDESKVEGMTKISDRVIQVRFNADTSSSMAWNFRPQQTELLVHPGETALSFYTATNPTDVPVIGIATYNVIPFEAGQYFNKIQCFCFEEQRLEPHEQVDMPVFFYIDPEYAHDPKLENVDTLTLSYTFFEAKEGVVLPIPEYARQH